MGFHLQQLRQWINRHSVAVTVGAVVALVLFLGFLWLLSRGSTSEFEGVVDAWFYDVETQERFVGKSGDVPPILRENGHNAVKVYLFTCGSCSNETEVFAGYYEGFTDEYKTLIGTPPGTTGGEAASDMTSTAEGFAKGRLISQDAVGWVPYNSAQGIAILAALNAACERKGGELKPCYPGKK